jgi:type II secretory pathway component PulF
MAIFIAAGLVAAGVFASRFLKTPQGRLLADQWKIKIPVAGPIFLMSAISRFCRVLGTFLRNGVPLLRSLEISSDSAGNIVLANALRQSAEQISSGESLSKPLAKCGLIPRGVMAMITTAEESNNLDQVLINVADGIDRRNARQLDMMVRLLEPVMLLVLGGVILFVLVGLLLPVFDMSSAM